MIDTFFRWLFYIMFMGLLIYAFIWAMYTNLIKMDEERKRMAEYRKRRDLWKMPWALHVGGEWREESVFPKEDRYNSSQE